MSGVGAGLDSFYEYLLKVTCNLVIIIIYLFFADALQNIHVTG